MNERMATDRASFLQLQARSDRHSIWIGVSVSRLFQEGWQASQWADEERSHFDIGGELSGVVAVMLRPAVSEPWCLAPVPTL